MITDFSFITFFFENYSCELTKSINSLRYKFETWILDSLFQMKLIGDNVYLIMWLCPITFSGPYITHFSCDKIDDFIQGFVLLKTIIGNHFNFIPYPENEITYGELHPLPCTNHVCNKSSTFKGLMNFNFLATIFTLFH